jgi:hypothetical protein
MSLNSWFRSLFAPKRAPAADEPYDTSIRIHLPASLRRRLGDLTRRRPGRIEPLAILRTRYASEDERRVIIGCAAFALPDEAYVRASDAAAAFSTRWLIDRGNLELRTNAGMLLAHAHGGHGDPRFSSIDARTNREVIARLSIGVDIAPYGAIVLSNDGASAVVATGGYLESARVIIVPDVDARGWSA